MKCSKCLEKGVIKQQSAVLCSRHFVHYFEKKVFKTISKYSMMQYGDKICVASSGGKDSLAALYMTMRYCRKQAICFFALAIDEGIAGYRKNTLKDLKAFCREFAIPLQVASFREKFGSSLDQVQKRAMKKIGKKPCTVCGILRRSLLNSEACKREATKLVTGHNLDDEAQTYLMNILLGNMGHNASLGPVTGLHEKGKFVQRVKPLYFIKEQETRLFAFLKGFKLGFFECPNIMHSFRAEVRDKLNALEELFPGTKSSVVSSFLDILPELKKKYKKNNKRFSYCTKCNDPCSGTICGACSLMQELAQDTK